MGNWSHVEHVRRACEDRNEAPEHVLYTLSLIAGAHQQLRDAESELIRTARRLGLPWREIATALSLGSPQAAAQRAVRVGAVGRRPEPADTDPRTPATMPRDPGADPDRRATSTARP